MIMRREVEPERWERRFSNADLHDDLDENEIRRAAQQGERGGHIDSGAVSERRYSPIV